MGFLMNKIRLIFLNSYLKLFLKITIFISCIFISFDKYSYSQQEIVVVGNHSSPDIIKKDDIKQIFLGNKTRWSKKQSIIFVLYNDKKICNIFLKEFVGKTYIQYKNYWKKLVFTGKGSMPKTSKNIEGIVDYVSKTKGAISFLPSNEVDTKELKIIKIDI